jgi:hypothetical protein
MASLPRFVRLSKVDLFKCVIITLFLFFLFLMCSWGPARMIRRKGVEVCAIGIYPGRSYEWHARNSSSPQNFLR